MQQNDPFASYAPPQGAQNAPQGAPHAPYQPPAQGYPPAPATQPTQNPGFPPTQAPAPGYGAPPPAQAPAQGPYQQPQTGYGAPAPAPQDHPAPGPGFGAPAQAPAPGYSVLQSQHTPPPIGFDPFGGYVPEVGGGHLRFPDEVANHLVRVDLMRLHHSKKSGMRQVVETTVIASTSPNAVPGQKPSTTFPMEGTHADREKTDLLAALVGFDKRRDKGRIVAEINENVHRAANYTPGAQATADNRLASFQGPGCFAGRYVLVESVRKPDKNDPNKIYTNFFWHAVPQPPTGQSYTPEQIQAILARQYEVPEPPPVQR